MTIEIPNPSAPGSLAERSIAWLNRLAALVLFGLGLFYWVRLVGIVPGPLWRFDLMPIPWRIAAPALAVLYPIAGVGLWMVVSWGVVVWVAAALVEAFMLFALPSVFGGHPAVFAGHALGLSLLGLLHLLSRANRRRGYTV